MAASLGAAFAIGHTPQVKQHIADKALEKDLAKEAEYQGTYYQKGMTKMLASTDAEGPEFQKERAERYLELLGSKKEELETKKAARIISPEEYAKQRLGAEGRERVMQQLIQSQNDAIEAKQGVKNAVKERRSFLKAMKDQPISFGKNSGGKFGELAPNLQKQIAKQYSKSERKKVMDEYYGK